MQVAVCLYSDSFSRQTASMLHSSQLIIMWDSLDSLHVGTLPCTGSECGAPGWRRGRRSYCPLQFESADGRERRTPTVWCACEVCVCVCVWACVCSEQLMYTGFPLTHGWLRGQHWNGGRREETSQYRTNLKLFAHTTHSSVGGGHPVNTRDQYLYGMYKIDTLYEYTLWINFEHLLLAKTNCALTPIQLSLSCTYSHVHVTWKLKKKRHFKLSAVT